MTNDYSDQWFSTFLQPIPPEQTKLEIDFLVRNLPQPKYHSVVDLCCGTGRHSYLLALLNYDVIGVDNHLLALNEAKRRAGNTVTYVRKDMRNFNELEGNFDAVLCLWQSFGYFDETTNRSVLRQISEQLYPHGRFIIDIYHRIFFEKHQGVCQFERDGILITERKQMADNRLSVTLTYHAHNRIDNFNWQLYTPTEFVDLLNTLGFDCVLVCTNFDETKSPSENSPRVQYVFEKIN